MVHHDSPLESFVQSLSDQDAALREQIAPKIGMLRRELFFNTVGDLWGSLHPEIPTTPRDKNRCLTTPFSRNPERQPFERRTAHLARAIGVSLKTTRQLVQALEAVPRPLSKVKPADSEWYLGARKRNRLRSGTEYHIVKAGEI